MLIVKDVLLACNMPHIASQKDVFRIPKSHVLHGDNAVKLF